MARSFFRYIDMASFNIWAQSLKDLLFPRLCGGCGHRLALGEQLVCARCQMTMPVETNQDWEYNRRKSQFEYSCLIRMGAFTRYERGNVASEIVRNLKFRHHYELGEWMGRKAVLQLRDTHLFDTVDLLVPIPLTESRLHSRGFNQAEAIARGMAAELGIPVRPDILKRLRDRESQTHFTLVQRFENADHVFTLGPHNDVQGCHLMVVDDVMTTGTTMLGAIDVLKKIPDVRISTFAWAWAYVPAPA